MAVVIVYEASDRSHNPRNRLRLAVRFRQLGSTDLRLSEVGFGLWTLSTEAWASILENDAAELLVAAFELGINYFDTADSDGEGYGETLLRKALGRERHNIIVSTKVGYDFYDRLAVREHGGPPPNFDPHYIRRASEESLRRLDTDYIDLQQLHHPPPDILQDDSLFDTLDDLVKEGKILHYGIALGPGLDFEEAGEIGIVERGSAALQLPYNLLNRDPARRLFRTSEDDNRPGFTVRSPHASGLLDGTYTKSSRLKREDVPSDEVYEALSKEIEHLAELDFLTDNMDSTIGQISIKFTLETPEVASVLPNITSIARLREFAATPETRNLPRPMLDRLAELHDDYFHPRGAKSEDE